ncbi:MAG: Wzz/FepE/Etk N-terminal domain-containing protein [Lachnospiraceae bacterium]
MEQTKQNDEIEIDLGELLSVLLSKWQIILLSGVVVAMIAFGISKFILPPVYESTTGILVLDQQSNQTLTITDLQTGTQLAKDYEVLVGDRTVVEQVIREMNLDMSYEAFLGIMTISTRTDTRILSITVEDYDPYQAMNIANKVREIATEHIEDIMDINSVKVVAEANLPTSASGPNVMKWTMIGGLLGIFISVGIALMFYLLNDSIKTPDDIERYLGLSTLGSIPIDENIQARGKKKKKVNTSNSTPEKKPQTKSK